MTLSLFVNMFIGKKVFMVRRFVFPEGRLIFLWECKDTYVSINSSSAYTTVIIICTKFYLSLLSLSLSLSLSLASVRVRARVHLHPSVVLVHG